MHTYPIDASVTTGLLSTAPTHSIEVSVNTDSVVLNERDICPHPLRMGAESEVWIIMDAYAGVWTTIGIL